MKIQSSLSICEKHLARMRYAMESLKDVFPISSVTYDSLSSEQISHSDQFLFRFTQLQETMGARLFPLILQGLGESDHAVPFIDMLNRLESFGVISSAEKWLDLRELRNLVTHEYPDNKNEHAESLNELFEQALYLETTFDNASRYIRDRWP